MDWANVAIQGILLGGLYALFATGLALVFGVMRMVNLAHGDLGILAAFLALFLVESIAWASYGRALICIAIMFVVGYLLQRGLLNFTLGTDDTRPIVVTFGLSIIIQNGLMLWFSADSQGLDAGGIENISIRDQREVVHRVVSRCWSSSSSIVVIGGASAVPHADQTGSSLQGHLRRPEAAEPHGHQQPPYLRAGDGHRAGHRRPCRHPAWRSGRPSIRRKARSA